MFRHSMHDLQYNTNYELHPAARLPPSTPIHLCELDIACIRLFHRLLLSAILLNVCRWHGSCDLRYWPPGGGGRLQVPAKRDLAGGTWLYMWQSNLEIEGYSVTYFDCIAAFEALYHWTSVKGGAHMRIVDSSDTHTSMKHIWAPPLTEVQWYSASKAAMQSKYVQFDFQIGLPL